METLLREDVSNYMGANNSKMRGHIFLRIPSLEKNSIVNATTGEGTNKVPDSHIAVKEGLDSWDIGLRNPEDYENLFLMAKQREISNDVVLGI